MMAVLSSQWLSKVAVGGSVDHMSALLNGLNMIDQLSFVPQGYASL